MTPKKSAGTAEVDAFMAGLTDARKPLLEAIRRVLLDSDSRVTEGIKWNAPSFHHKDWFGTTNLRGKAGVMLVLHTGAKIKASATTGVPVKDPTAMLNWLAKDRAVVSFADLADLKAREAALRQIVKQWGRLM
jgi:hypothetical protein